MSIPDTFNPIGVNFSGNFPLGSMVIFGREKSVIINLNTAENLNYLFSSATNVYIPRGITFKGCKSAYYAFMYAQNVTFSEDVTFENCENFTQAFSNTSIILPVNLSLDKAKILDACFYAYGRTFTDTNWAEHLYPEATSMNDFFCRNNNVTYVNISAPKLTSAMGFAGHSRSIKQIVLNAPNLENVGDGGFSGAWGFCGNSTIEKLTIIQDESKPKLSSIGCFVEGCNNLREVDVNFGALTQLAQSAFKSTKLNYASVYRIASTLPSNASSKAFGTLGIDKTLQNNSATLEAIQMIRDKNWTVTPQWNA